VLTETVAACNSYPRSTTGTASFGIGDAMTLPRNNVNARKSILNYTLASRISPSQRIIGWSALDFNKYSIVVTQWCIHICIKNIF
jgi:hypothetical protein